MDRFRIDGASLASLQVGIRPTDPGGSNGTQSSGAFYGVKQSINSRPSHATGIFPSRYPLRTSNLRAPGDVARCFASEGFLDEIAADLKVDPVEFRLNHLTANKRAAECFESRRRQSRLAKTAIARTGR